LYSLHSCQTYATILHVTLEVFFVVVVGGGGGGGVALLLRFVLENSV
jgi:hypothetical protein